MGYDFVDIVKVNDYTIAIPRGLGYDPKANRDDYISYVESKRGIKELHHHFQALTTLLAPRVKALRPKPRSVLHAFGGLGVTAQVLNQAVPGMHHVFWERSPQCCGYLNKEWGNCVLVEDSHDYVLKQDLAPYDIIVFDPSLGSIKSQGMIESLVYIAKFSPRLLWVSDMAVSKLHLNGGAYASVFGEATPTPESYAHGYDEFLRSLGLCITGAIRDSFEMYFVIQPRRRTKTDPGFIVEKM